MVLEERRVPVKEDNAASIVSRDGERGTVAAKTAIIQVTKVTQVKGRMVGCC